MILSTHSIGRIDKNHCAGDLLRSSTSDPCKYTFRYTMYTVLQCYDIVLERHVQLIFLYHDLYT